MKKSKKIVFVCLGNICRSPMGEGAMLSLVEKDDLNYEYEIDSAGTSAYHIGNQADQRMRDVAYSHGIKLTSRARQFVKSDLETFDYIIAMDENNYRDIVRLNPDYEHKVHLMRTFDDMAVGDLNVPDPYYGGIAGFEEVYQITARACQKLLQLIESDGLTS